MKKVILCQVFFVAAIFWGFGQQLNGVIYYQNSNGKTAGQKLKLVIGSTDSEGKNIEVVNTRQLEWLRMPENPIESPIEVIVCYAGQKDQATLRYYGILVKPTSEKYEHQLNRIETQLQQKNLDASTTAILIAQMGNLKKERDDALEKIKDQAEFIAVINKDQASDMVRSAIEKIEHEEDIDAALAILDDTKLEEAYQLAQEKKQKGEVEIQQVIEGYELKIRLLRTFNDDAEDIISRLKHIIVRYKHIIECYKHIIEIYKNNGDKEQLAIVYNEIAEAYRRLGIYESALKYNQNYYVLEEEFFDSKHYETALKYHQKSIAIREGILGLKNLDLAAAYDNIAATYACLEQDKTALEYRKKSVEIQEKILGLKHPDLALSYGSIALTYQSLKQYETALEYHKKTIDIREEVLPPKHPSLAISYNNIAYTYRAIKLYENALKYQQKAIAIHEETLDPKHSELAYHYKQIGFTYKSLGQYESALKYHQKSIAIKKDILDSKNTDLAISYSSIALIYKEMKDFQKAITFQKKCLVILKEAYPEDHPIQKKAFNTMAKLYYTIYDLNFLN